MAVENRPHPLDEQGQSVLEFMMMFPMLIGLTVLLVRINTAIQVSIVNQQYARAHALFLTYNNPYYPEIRFQSRLISTATNQMILGISNNPSEANSGGGTYKPEATTQLISRNTKLAAGSSDAPHEEPQVRANVRIRNSVTLCTQTLFLNSGQGGPQAILALQGANPPQAAGPNALNEGSRFNNLCGSPIKYEQ